VQGYRVEDIGGLDGFARRDPEVLRNAEKQWQKDGTGILATSLIGEFARHIDLTFRLYVQAPSYV
jgi:hypothetical protein